MASTFTPNISIEKPANGDFVGTWDVPVNANMSAIDLAFGQAQSINLAAGSVTLSTAQARSVNLIFTGNLLGNVTVTIPGLSSAPGTTVSGRFYTVQNQCGNSSAFTVTLATTVAGSQAIGVPPYAPTDILIEGTGGVNVGSIKFRSLGPVGSYWDYAGSSSPAWLAACSIPPWIYCNGQAFSSAAYPALALLLNATNVPDLRGRYRATINDGSARITSGASTGGIDGNTIFSAGGSQTTTLSSQHIPRTALSDPGHSHVIQYQATSAQSGGGVSNTILGGAGATTNSCSATTGITIGNTTTDNFSNLPPSIITGMTFIRAA